MKKILSFVLAAATSMQLCIGSVSAADEPIVKKTYSVTELASFRPTSSNSASNRSFSFDTYQTGGKTYAYILSDVDGLLVYDVTDPENIGAPIQNIANTTMKGGNNNLHTTEIAGGKLYAYTVSSWELKCMTIGADGKLDVDNIQTGINTKMLSAADNFVFYTTNNAKTIDVIDAAADDYISSIATYTDTTEHTGTANVRALKAFRTSDGKYRVAYVLQTNNADAAYEFNVVDYDASTKEFSLVCEAVVSEWATNGFYNMEFLSDKKVIVPYNKEAYYVADFTSGTLSITKAQEQSGSNNIYIQKLYDGEFAAWDNTSYIKDFTAAEVTDISSTTMVGAQVKDADITGDVNSENGAVVYLAADSKVIIANVKRNSVTEEAYSNTNVIDKTSINPGEVTTITTDGVRLKTSVAAKIGEKTVVYGMDSNASGALKAFDVTDGKTATQLGSAVAYSDAQSAPMYVKNNNLIFASANNVTVVSLNDDGSIGNQVFAYATGNSVADLEVVDDLLFASSLNANNGVTIYDISAPTSSTKPLTTIKTDAGVRSLAVEKISNIRYRIYIATRDDSNNTMKLTIKDFVYALGSISVEDVFDAATPSYESGLSWIAGNNGYLDLVKAGYIVAEYNNLGRFVVDVTKPSEPKVVKVLDNTSNNGEASCRRRKVNLDSTKVVEISWAFANGTYIMDYSNPTEPEQLAQIAIAANGASVVDNYLYTTEDGAINAVKLYDKLVEKVVTYSDITFNQNTVSDADTTASVTAQNNTDVACTPTLIIALYDADGTLVSVEISVGNVQANTTGTISATISADSIPTDTTGHYFKAMLWKNTTSLEPIMNYVSLGK